MRKPVWIALLGFLALTACGPVPDLLVGVRSLVLPIVLSAPQASPTPTPAAVPLPVASLPPLSAQPFVLPYGATVQLPPPTPACPDAGPLTFPAVAASDFVAEAAPAGNFNYRATVQQGGTTSTVAETRAVGNVQNLGGGAYSFQELVTGGPQSGTTYTYTTDSTQVALASIKFPDKSTFNPVTPIKLLQTPADPTAGGWTSAGADPLSGDSMTYQAQGVTGRKHVNTCGQLVDSWEVKATATLVVPQRGEKIDETLVYDFATQYGGLIVQELNQSTNSGVSNSSTQEAAAIDEVP